MGSTCHSNVGFSNPRLLMEHATGFHQGFGQHFEVLGEDYATNFLRELFTQEILYTLVICLVKLSILAFYWRLFVASIRIPCYILGGITISWAIATITACVAQCNPVSGFWNHSIPAKCGVNDHAALVGVAIPNILTDAALLSLPIPYIWRLHRTRPQKIALIGIFMLGGFVTIVSSVRLAILVHVDSKSPDLDYNYAWFGVLTELELNIGIVSACLPSLRPILCLIIYHDPNPSAWSSKSHASGRDLNPSHPSASTHSCGEPPIAMKSHHKFIALADETNGISGVGHSQATAIAETRNIYGHEDIEMQPSSRPAGGEINVRSDVNVKWAQRN